jgi:predicted HicB family RNase H-like nuclease
MNKKKNPRLSQFNVRLTTDELEVLRRKAWDENKSISTYVRELIQDALSFGITPSVK